MTNCLICGGSVFQSVTDIYKRCGSCGHDIRVHEDDLQEITNDDLNEIKIKKLDRLTQFKINLMKRISSLDDGIFDVGTASGKFIYHLHSTFTKVAGVEVNFKCREFSKDKLKISVYADVSEANTDLYQHLTFWHSLEHIPLEVSEHIINSFSYLNTIVISVPNSQSWLFNLFKSHWAYYDKTSHLYQFSPRSLEIFMEKIHWRKSQEEFGLFYESFGVMQTFLNVFSKRHNYLYYRLKRGILSQDEDGGSGWLEVVRQAFLAPFVSLATLIVVPFLCLKIIQPSVITYVFRSEKRKG